MGLGKIALAAAAAFLVAACGTAEPPPASTPASTDVSTDATATPTLAAADGADLSDAELVTIRSAQATIDGDVIQVEVHVPAWPDAARAELLVHYLHLVPAGFEQARPPVSLTVGPEWVAGPDGARLDVILPEEEAQRMALPATLERDEVGLRLVATTRIPQAWLPIAQVLVQTTLVDEPRGTTARDWRSVMVVPVPGTVATSQPAAPAVALAAPQARDGLALVTLTPDGGALLATVEGLPAALRIPSDWEPLPGPSGHVSAQDPTGAVYIGLHELAHPEGLTPAEVLDAIVQETDGAYVIEQRDDIDAGAFAATVVVRTARTFQVGDDDPQRILSNWYSVEGNVLRLAATEHEGATYFAYVEAPDAARLAEFEGLLADVRFD